MRTALLCVLAGLLLSPAAQADERLNGSGSSFILPLMERWATRYKEEKKVEVNYQAKGSGAGVTAMTAKEVEFGCTDAPMTPQQLEKAKAEG
jgi:phosphate transport system substrate-binding protein